MLFWFVLIGSLALDQLTKFIISTNMNLRQTIPVIEDIFHITYVTNYGAAFGILQGQRWLFIVITLAALSATLIFLRSIPKTAWRMRLSLGLFCGGALGNFVDRIFNNGAVIDFIDFRVFPIFNFADMFIIIGCALLVIEVFRMERQEKRAKQAGKVQQTQAEELVDATTD